MYRVTSLGHSSFRLELPDGRWIYFDPWLKENPACPPHLQTIERADIVLVSHGHFDHLDPTLPEIVNRTGARVIAPAAVRLYLEEKGTQGVEKINVGGSVDIGGLSITLTEGHHGSHIPVDGHAEFPHESCGFVLRASSLPTIYYSGDTAAFSGMELISRMYSPEVAFLPIGGRYTMGPYEAAWATKMLGVRTVVPMHYGTLPNLPGTLEEFQQELAEEIIAIVPFKPGQTIEME